MSVRPLLVAVLGGFLLLTSWSAGQEPKKDDPKAAKKDEPPVKLKGFLPANWGKIGLTDDQKQDVYRIQAKYNGEIDKLEAKIRELKTTRDKELKTVLTEDQKKKLQEILTGGKDK